MRSLLKAIRLISRVSSKSVTTTAAAVAAAASVVVSSLSRLSFFDYNAYYRARCSANLDWLQGRVEDLLPAWTAAAANPEVQLQLEQQVLTLLEQRRQRFVKWDDLLNQWGIIANPLAKIRQRFANAAAAAASEAAEKKCPAADASSLQGKEKVATATAVAPARRHVVSAKPVGMVAPGHEVGKALAR